MPSKPGSRPESLDAPGISARQERFQEKKGVRFKAPMTQERLELYEGDLVPFTAFLNSSTKRLAASASVGGGAVLLGSFGLVFESFDKAKHSKEQSHSGCYVDG
jgi:hypothetical protein